MKRLFVLVLIFTIISGCSTQSANDKPAPGTPEVSSEQAEEVARNVYGLTQIESINLRSINEDEKQHLTTEQLQLTPVYYVIAGLAGSEKVTTYISSNEVKHHFSVSDQP